MAGTNINIDSEHAHCINSEEAEKLYAQNLHLWYTIWEGTEPSMSENFEVELDTSSDGEGTGIKFRPFFKL